ncbi:MAG: hypothetical protein IPO40_17095 [Fibrobacteres bacterium]|nr:hypothetical protein [Fibrobacterota bacterium]
MCRLKLTDLNIWPQDQSYKNGLEQQQTAFSRYHRTNESIPPGEPKMSNAALQKPFALNVLLFLLVFEFISAIPYGLMLAFDPSGKVAGMDVEVLKETVFSNYFIPGLILFSVIGIGSSLLAASILLRPNWSWFAFVNPVKSLHWS